MTGKKANSEVIYSYHHRQKDKIEKIQKSMANERFSKNEYGTYEKIESKSEVQKNNPIKSKVVLEEEL